MKKIQLGIGIPTGRRTDVSHSFSKARTTPSLARPRNSGSIPVWGNDMFPPSINVRREFPGRPTITRR